MNTALHAKVERFEDRYAVLRHEALGEFKWPLSHFPERVNVGETVVLNISTERATAENKEEEMRRLLEELIN